MYVFGDAVVEFLTKEEDRCTVEIERQLQYRKEARSREMWELHDSEVDRQQKLREDVRRLLRIVHVTREDIEEEQ